LLLQNGIRLTGLQRTQFDLYVELLTDWNRRINLISRRDEENIWLSHIFHSLTPLLLLEFPERLKVLDLGTGGGLPGIPLAILHGNMAISLLDSIRKKTVALQEIVAELGLPEAQVLLGRAEGVAKEPHFSADYDMVVARAVAPLSDLVKWGGPFLRPKGGGVTKRRTPTMAGKSEFRFPYLLALKGGDLESELQAVRLQEPSRAITEINLVFPGSEQVDLADKKILIVEFT
jgi:16S rRNA (guanine527-N7)-methyltransferase